MIGAAQVLEAARQELGDRILQKPVKCFCPTCSSFVAAVLVVPNLVRGRCSRCRVDVLVLVNANREVLAVTDR